MLGRSEEPSAMVTKPAKAGTPFADSPIAAYIAKQVEVQQSMGKSQREIAAEAGYDKPNMISMFKTGAAKVPLERVPRLAKALGLDPAFLFRLAVQQYWPEDAEAIGQIFGLILSKNEVEIVEYIRKVTKGSDPRLTNDLKSNLRAAFE